MPRSLPLIEAEPELLPGAVVYNLVAGVPLLHPLVAKPVAPVDCFLDAYLLMDGCLKRLRGDTVYVLDVDDLGWALDDLELDQKRRS